MNKAKILSLFLAIFMLMGCVALLPSCGGADGTVDVSKKTLTMDLSGFVVYYGDELAKNEVIGDMADDMAALLSERTGKKTSAREIGRASCRARV